MGIQSPQSFLYGISIWHKHKICPTLTAAKEGLGLKETWRHRIWKSNIFNLRVPEMDLIAVVFVLASDL